MLIRKPQVHIVSREVTLPTGELVRAFFAVIETEGVREIKFLGTKPISDAAPSQEAEVLMLEAPRTTIWSEIFIPSYFEAVSPFYTLDFLTSQLARAPNKR